MCVDIVRVHGLCAMKAPGFSHQLERDSRSRVLFTINNLKVRAEWMKGLSTAFDMLPQQAWHDLYVEWISDFFLNRLQRNSQLVTIKRTNLWHHPAKLEGMLFVALHFIKHYADAGHGEADSFNHLTACPNLQAAFSQKED